MNILRQYIKPFRWRVALMLALAAATYALHLYDPIILGRIIDEYVLNPNNLPEAERVRGALIWLAIATAIALVSRLLSMIQSYVSTFVIQSAGKQIFDDGLRHTLRMSYQEYEDSSSGGTVAMLQKIRMDVQRFINTVTDVLVSSLVGLAFLIWYAITKSWLMIPIFLLGLVLLGGLNSQLSKRIREIQKSIIVETRRMYGAMTETLRNIELIKSLGLGRAEAQRMRASTQHILELELEKERRVRSLSVLQGTILNVLKQSILFILLWLIFRNVLSAGELVSLQVIINTIFGPLSSLGGFILMYREVEASLQQYEELMQRPVETRPETPVQIGAIESLRFEDVVFRHRTATANAIDHVSFQAHLGDTIAFVGPSGSGKSTLVKLLVGLYRPIEGTIFIDETPVNELRFNQVRRQIGFVTQDAQLFSGTIRENMLFVKADATDEEMLAALEKAAARPILERANGLDSRLGEGGMRISGGERQRISIARALLRDPALLIFDEATSALDSITEKEITAVIEQISAEQQKIVILIAHRLSTIAHANRIYVLEKGRIVESGTHDELVAALGLYYAMWRQQVGEREYKEFIPEAQPVALGAGVAEGLRGMA